MKHPSDATGVYNPNYHTAVVAVRGLINDTKGKLTEVIHALFTKLY